MQSANPTLSFKSVAKSGSAVAQQKKETIPPKSGWKFWSSNFIGRQDRVIWLVNTTLWNRLDLADLIASSQREQYFPRPEEKKDFIGRIF